MPHPYPSPQLNPLFELSATLERFDDLGETPQGHRMLAVLPKAAGPSAEIECAARCYAEAEETGCYSRGPPVRIQSPDQFS